MPLTATNLKYKGAFKVSPGTNWQQQLVLNYGGHAIGYNPVNNSLIIAGHDWTQCVGEVTIPTPKTSAYNTASLLQQPRVISIPQDSQGSTIKWGGFYVENGNLYGTRYTYYDASFQSTRSHGKMNGTTLTASMQGLFTVSAPNPGWVAGYIGTIPAEHQSKFGGKTHFTGIGNLAILSRASNGVSAFAFNLSDLGSVNPVSTVPMVGYDVNNPLGGNISNSIYNAADTIRGAVFVGDTLLFFGVHGKGAYCYGTGAECNDSADNSKGVHAYPYTAFVWAYSVNDLADVAAGRKQMHQILPTATWELTDIVKGRTSISHNATLSTAYDPVTKRVFISEMYADGELPLIHVYEIDTGATPPPTDTTPPTITNIQVSEITQTSAKITWTTDELSDTRVEYGLTTGYGTIAVDQVDTLQHSMVLTNLQPGTVYNFRVKSWDPSDNSRTSANQTLSTLAVPPPTVVNVSTLAQLQSAIANLVNGQTINIANGTYTLPDALYFPPNVNDVTIKGVSQAAIIDGNNVARFGFWLSSNQRITISDLTVRNCKEHGILANYGAHNLKVERCIILDCGDQFIKSNPGSTDVGNDNGIVTGCVIGYTTNAPDEYTNGVDVHSGKNWVITNNTFQNIVHPTLLCGPAVLVWNHSQDTVVKGNKFINCAREISLGLILRNGTSDHVGGLVCNNTSVRNKAGVYDVPVGIMDSPGTIVLHNTILCGNTYPSSVEYRFPRTTGVTISANLTDKPITARDSAVGTAQNNQTNANVSLFVDPSLGDLHLKAGITSIQTVTKSSLVPDDMDGAARSATTLVGADEIVVVVDPCQSIQDQLNVTQAQLLGLQASYNALVIENNNLTSTVNNLTSQNTQLMSQINSLTSQNSQLTSQITTLNGQIVQLNTSLQILNGQLSQVNDEKAALELQLESAQVENVALSAQIAQLLAQKSQLKQDLLNLANAL